MKTIYSLLKIFFLAIGSVAPIILTAILGFQVGQSILHLPHKESFLFSIYILGIITLVRPSSSSNS